MQVQSGQYPVGIQQGMFQGQPILNQPVGMGGMGYGSQGMQMNMNMNTNPMMMGANQPFMQQQGGYFGQPQQQGGFMGADIGGGGRLGQMGGSLVNQVNPNPFAHSGIPGMSENPQIPPIMPIQPMPNVPVGLELLVDLEQITVKQKAEFLEVMVGFETANRYNVLNGGGQRIYFAGETTERGSLCCGGVQRPFKITIVDFSGRVVLQIERPCDPALYITNCWPCCCCLLGSIGGKVSVTLADGTRLGEIVHVFGCYQPQYDVMDDAGIRLMTIKGPQCADCCLCSCVTCGTTDFNVLMDNGQELGKIQKKFTGLQELYTDADTFGVNFPKDLIVKWKALIFAAVFLIDFMYFEQKSGKSQTTGMLT